MWRRLGQQDDPAWRRTRRTPRATPSTAGPLLRFPESLSAPLGAPLVGPRVREAPAGRDGSPEPAGEPLTWDLSASVLDEEIRMLIAAADTLLAQHMPSASPESLKALSEALAAVFRERLLRLGGTAGDTTAYEELLRRRLVRMSMDLGASEAELAEVKEKLAQFLAMGDWPSNLPVVEGLSPDSANYKKKLALLTRIVEENIALRSRPDADQGA